MAIVFLYLSFVILGLSVFAIRGKVGFDESEYYEPCPTPGAVNETEFSRLRAFQAKYDRVNLVKTLV